MICQHLWRQCMAPKHTTPRMRHYPHGIRCKGRSGHFGKRRQIKAGGVADTLAAISTTFQLAGKSSPIHRSENKYRLSLQRLMESYRQEDPLSIPNLAVPVIVPTHIYKAGMQSTDPKIQAAGCLSIVAFFFLLRVGEYT